MLSLWTLKRCWEKRTIWLSWKWVLMQILVYDWSLILLVSIGGWLYHMNGTVHLSSFQYSNFYWSSLGDYEVIFFHSVHLQSRRHRPFKRYVTITHSTLLLACLLLNYKLVDSHHCPIFFLHEIFFFWRIFKYSFVKFYSGIHQSLIKLQ